MGLPNLSLLSKLRKAVQKVAFLLKYRVHHWRLGSGIAVSPRSFWVRGFNDRSGLRACAGDGDSDVSGSGCQGSSRQRGRLVGCPFEEDIDKRAEAFIANFHHRLQIETGLLGAAVLERGHGFDSHNAVTEHVFAGFSSDVSVLVHWVFESETV